MLFFFWPRLKMIVLDVDVESRDLRLRSVLSCVSLCSSAALERRTNVGCSCRNATTGLVAFNHILLAHGHCISVGADRTHQ